MADLMRVCLQQRKRLLREGLGQLLEAEADIQLAGSVESPEEMPGLCDEQRPDVVLLEVEGGAWDPSRLVARLAQRPPGPRVLGLYVVGIPGNARQIRRCGVRLLSHQGGIDPVLRAVRGDPAALAGPTELTGLPGEVTSSGEERGRRSLTAREVSVLSLIGGGFTTREISTQLSISHKTVDNHKQRIFGKLGVQNQAHAVSIAVRRGLISPERPLELPLELAVAQ